MRLLYTKDRLRGLPQFTWNNDQLLLRFSRVVTGNMRHCMLLHVDILLLFMFHIALYLCDINHKNHTVFANIWRGLHILSFTSRYALQNESSMRISPCLFLLFKTQNSIQKYNCVSNNDERRFIAMRWTSYRFLCSFSPRNTWQRHHPRFTSTSFTPPSWVTLTFTHWRKFDIIFAHDTSSKMWRDNAWYGFIPPPKKSMKLNSFLYQTTYQHSEVQTYLCVSVQTFWTFSESFFSD